MLCTRNPLWIQGYTQAESEEMKKKNICANGNPKGARMTILISVKQALNIWNNEKKDQ